MVPNQNLLNKLLSVNQIGEWPVECCIPMRDKFKYGVIYPVDLDTDLGKLKHDINTPETELPLRTTFQMAYTDALIIFFSYFKY